MSKSLEQDGPNGAENNLERRIVLVEQFKTAVQTGVDQMSLNPAAWSARIDIRSTGITYVHDPKNMSGQGTSPKLVIQHPERINGKLVTTTFSPYEDVWAKHGVDVKDELSDGTQVLIGSRVLSVPEIDDLVRFIQSPPMHFSLLEKLAPMPKPQ